MSTFPSQKQSMAEKVKRDSVTKKTWGETCGDYLIENGSWDTDREEIYRLKRIVDGEFDDNDYKYVLNPFNTTIDRYKRFGAKLQNFNILSPVRDLYMGEFGKRFKHIQVMETNPDDDNLYKEGLNRIVKNYYTQEAINALNALGIETGQETVTQEALAVIESKYKRNFDENRVITGQETLDFIKYDKELDDKYQDIYEDWIVCGRAITYKGISYNDLDFEHVPAEQLSFPKNMKSRFLEDAAWVVRREVLQPHQILDSHGEKLDQETKDWLNERMTNDNLALGNGARFVVMPTQYVSNGDYKNIASDSYNGIELYHFVWRSWRKVGLLMTINELSQIEEIEVDETYKLNREAGDLNITWDWITQVWEGYRAENDKYFGIRPLPYNRAALNNSGLQKLPYNGRFMITNTGSVKSIIKTGEPYQALYNIAHYQFEKVLNKNKDKIAVIPQGLIPKGKGGWDEEKFMYYSFANSLMVFDESSPTAALALQGIKVLDMTLGAYIKDMVAIMQEIKFEWWDAIGMNRQRYGDTQASDGKGVTEQAIFRSSIISEELNRKFEKLQEKDYAGLLDLSKLAYLKGKKGKYITSDQREAFLNLSPDDAIRRLESDFGVFVRNSSRENENLEALKQYAFSYAQNDRNPSMLMEMLDSTNYTKSKYRIKQLEDKEREYEQATAKQQQQAEAAIEASRREGEQAKLDVEKYKADKAYETAIDVKLLELGANEDSLEGKEEDPEKKQEERRMNDHKIDMDKKNFGLDKEGLKIKEKETNARIKSLANKVT